VPHPATNPRFSKKWSSSDFHREEKREIVWRLLAQNHKIRAMPGQILETLPP